MAGVPSLGHESRAPCGFAGAATALSRAVPLADGEQVLMHGVGRVRDGWRLPRPILLRLSSWRLVALTHYAFAPDRVLELPRDAVVDVAVHGHVLHVSWRRAPEVTATLQVGPWTGPARLDRPLPVTGELGRVLSAWLRPD